MTSSKKHVTTNCNSICVNHSAVATTCFNLPLAGTTFLVSSAFSRLFTPFRAGGRLLAAPPFYECRKTPAKSLRHALGQEVKANLIFGRRGRFRHGMHCFAAYRSVTETGTLRLLREE